MNEERDQILEEVISHIKTMVPDQYGMLPKHKVISFIRELKTNGDKK